MPKQWVEHHHLVSHMKVAQMLHELDYSLQGNRKTEEGADHPDRDAQFRHINAAVKQCLGQVSRDFRRHQEERTVRQLPQCRSAMAPANSPSTCRPRFPQPAVPRAYPYGIYDIGRNAGFVNVGTDHDTGAFAVASIRGWWRAEGAASTRGQPGF